MKRKWEESTAVAYLKSKGIEITNKKIIAKNGLGGLTACSARDYLVNYCNYN